MSESPQSLKDLQEALKPATKLDLQQMEERLSLKISLVDDELADHFKKMAVYALGGLALAGAVFWALSVLLKTALGVFT